MKPVLRDIVTPAAIALFLGSCLTGVALFFHWNPGLVHTAHEWLGLPFVAIVLWHAFRHWRGLISYAKRPLPAAVVALLIVSSVTLVAATSSPGQGNPHAVIEALSTASLASAAAAFGLSPQQATAILQTRGVAAATDEKLIDVARNSGKSPVVVLTMLSAGGR